jgi:putative transposase
MRSYEKIEVGSTENLRESLDEIARQGALKLLSVILEQEVVDFLGRGRYERTGEFNGYRNGYGKRRKVAIGSGTMELRAPRVRDTLEPFDSRILRKYQRQSGEVQIECCGPVAGEEVD